jgi:hypothetical protein
VSPHVTFLDLCVTALPPTGVQAVWRHAQARRDVAALRVLAARRDLPVDVAAALAGDADWRIARTALRHTSDAGVLVKAASSGVKRLEGVVANPGCDVEVLAGACRHDDTEVRLWAWGNTGTPLANRQAAMRRRAVQDVVDRGKNNADRAARAWVVASANPWLAEEHWAWELNPLARALACSSAVSDELVAGRGGPIGRKARRGRLRPGQDLLAGGVLDVELWCDRSSAIVDLDVVRDARLGFDDAVRVWTAPRHIEPHVLAALAERFGYRLATVPSPQRSEARGLAVWRLSPVAHAAALLCANAVPLELPADVDGDAVWWERVVALADGWAGTIDELLACATAL